MQCVRVFSGIAQSYEIGCLIYLPRDKMQSDYRQDNNTQIWLAYAFAESLLLSGKYKQNLAASLGYYNV